jgi:phosphatidylglycerol:prolipoprotein diacylglycerol transferase
MTLGEFFTAASYGVGGFVFWLSARRRGLDTKGIGVVVLVGFVAGILGAKITQLVFQGWPLTVPAEAALDPRVGGRALLGGLLFGWLGVELAKRRLGIRRSTGDHFALALPAGEAVGRIGCHLNGCCYGAACDLPWAIHQHGADRHPAQLYSAAAAASLFGLLLWLRPRLSREGDLFRAYLVGFGIIRFGLEFFRWRESLVFGLSPMQWFCLELVVSVLIYTLWRRRREFVARAL